MSIGSLSAHIRPDDPSRVHHGPSDPVKGTVELVYCSSVNTPSNELFGRLVLDITFHGRTKTKIRRSNGQSTTIYRGRVPLFSHTYTIYNDVFKTSAGERQFIPFEVYFPPRTSYAESDWKDDYEFESLRQDLPLPPSMEKASTSRFPQAFVEYRIGCAMRMDGLRLDLNTHGKYDEPVVQYDLPQTPINAAVPMENWRGVVSVSNKELLPEDQRPSGLKEKMKATFSSDYYPTYAFDWTIQAPRHIPNGSPIHVIVDIKPREPSKREHFVVPSVHFSHCSLEIKSLVSARTERKMFHEAHEHSSSTELQRHGEPSSRGAFSGDDDWTQVWTFQPFFLPTSFRHVSIKKEHKFKLRGMFAVAGQTESISHEWAGSILPPYEGSPTGMSSALVDLGGPSDSRPSKEMLAGLPVQPDLLAQELAPPLYAEAVGDRAVGSSDTRREKGMEG